MIDNWLSSIRELNRRHREELAKLTHTEAINRLCELNVIEQVHNVCATTIVHDAWHRGENVQVEGWVYSIRDGILKELCSRGPETVDQNPEGEVEIGTAAARG